MCNCGKARSVAPRSGPSPTPPAPRAAPAPRARAVPPSRARVVTAPPPPKVRVAPVPPAPKVRVTPAPPAPTTAISKARQISPNFTHGWTLSRPAEVRTKSGLVPYVTSLWGPGLWRALHTAAEVGDLTAWATVPAAVAVSLPCPDCEKHYAAWLRARPAPPASSDRTAVRKWLLDLHNAVNKRNRKSTWTAEQVTAAYTDVAAALSALESVASMVGPQAVAALRAALPAAAPVEVPTITVSDP